MSITRKFREAERAAAREDENNEERVKGPTLKEILADNERSSLFAIHLQEEGDEELIGKLQSGELSHEELGRLSERRQSFLEIMESAQELKDRFKTKNIAELVKASPELRAIADLVGAEGINAALLRRFDRLAVASPDEFNRLKRAAEDVDRTSEALDEEDERVAEICRRYGIKESEYLAALQSDDQDAVNQLVESRMGKWKKLWSSRRKINMEVSAADRYNEIRRLSEEHDESFAAAARALDMTLGGNAAMHEALVADLMGRSPEKEEKELSYTEFMKIAVDEEQMKKDWTAYRSLHEKEPNFSEESAKEDFADGYYKVLTKHKKGLWAIFGKYLFKPQIKKNLK